MKNVDVMEQRRPEIPKGFMINSDGDTVLIAASKLGHLPVVQLLIDRRADVNVKDMEMTASNANAEHLLEEYNERQQLEQMVDLNMLKNWSPDGLLQLAASHGDIGVFKQAVGNLLNEHEKFADTAKKTYNYVFNLLTTVQSSRRACELDVLSYSTLLDKLNRMFESQTELEQHHGIFNACYEGDIDEVQRCLMSGISVDAQDQYGMTALMYASGKGHREIAQLLLQYDTDVNAQNKEGWTALMWASIHGHREIAQLLLEHVPDVNAQDKDGWTALMLASKGGHTETVLLLLEHLAEINVTVNGWTALMFASKYGHREITQLLLEYDPDVNARSKDGWTALMLASEGGHTGIVLLLLEHLAEINFVNKDGWTALMRASGHGRKYIAQLLLEHDPDVNARSKGPMQTANRIRVLQAITYKLSFRAVSKESGEIFLDRCYNVPFGVYYLNYLYKSSLLTTNHTLMLCECTSLCLYTMFRRALNLFVYFIGFCCYYWLSKPSPGSCTNCNYQQFVFVKIHRLWDLFSYLDADNIMILPIDLWVRNKTNLPIKFEPVHALKGSRAITDTTEDWWKYRKTSGTGSTPITDRTSEIQFEQRLTVKQSQAITDTTEDWRKYTIRNTSGTGSTPTTDRTSEIQLNNAYKSHKTLPIKKTALLL